MLELHKTAKFVRDYRRMQKRGRDMQLLKSIVHTLRIPASLPSQNKNHLLVGNLNGLSECHIQNDWLLVYYCTEDGLFLIRTGTHSDLFR